MKKSKALWALALFFTWAALKSAGNIFGAQHVVDYAIMAGAGIPWLFYALIIPLMVGEISVAWLLFLRRSEAYRIGSMVILGEVAVAMAFLATAYGNPDVFRAALVAEREASGRAVHSDMLDFATSLPALALALAFYALLYGAVYYFLRKVRPELGVTAA